MEKVDKDAFLFHPAQESHATFSVPLDAGVVLRTCPNLECVSRPQPPVDSSFRQSDFESVPATISIVVTKR